MPQLFERPTVKVVDDRQHYGETPTNCLGEIEGRVFAVAYAWRGANRRIISARKARENGKHITRVSSDETRRLKDLTDTTRLDAMTDDDIARAVADDPDAPPLDLDWTQARLSLPPGKQAVTLRLDRDVLNWLRAQGKGYQTRINQVLRAWYDAARHKKAVAIQKARKKRAAQKAAATRAAPAKRRA